jgi:RNA polymerase sigma-70 factor, ECF subfamily
VTSVEPVDRVLVERWAAGRDPVAFTELVARHGALMRRIAIVALGTASRRDPGLVDDALQEACIRLLGALRSFRGDSSPATFMAAVARRAALDELRKGLRHRAKADRATLSVEPRDPSDDDPAVSAERAAAAWGVLEALGRLREPDRSLLYLRDAEGMDVAGLAVAFRLPEGTVKSKLARARSKVRMKVAREWGLP